MEVTEITPHDFRAKRAATYLKSKAVILTTRITQDEFERAIFKTTSSKNKAPNAKHLKRLIHASFASYTPHTGMMDHVGARVGSVLHGVSGEAVAQASELDDDRSHTMTNKELVARLEKRLHTHDWVVTLKTLIVFHYLVRDGAMELHDVIIQSPGLFHTSKVKDFATADYGRCFSRFIAGYLRYMEERCACMQHLQRHVPSERQRRMEEGDFIPSMFHGWPMYRIIEATDALLSQLATLVSIDIELPMDDNPVAVCGLQLLVTDSKRLVSLISDRCMHLLDHSSDMTEQLRTMAFHTLTEYHKRCRDTNFFYAKVVSMMRRCCHLAEHDSLSALSLPTILEIPLDEIERIFYPSSPLVANTNAQAGAAPQTGPGVGFAGSASPASVGSATEVADETTHEIVSLTDLLSGKANMAVEVQAVASKTPPAAAVEATTKAPIDPLWSIQFSPPESAPANLFGPGPTSSQPQPVVSNVNNKEAEKGFAEWESFF